jgi:hypothetical protein
MSTNSILATAPLVTTNFLLRATGTTIGNSLIFDNGTNVGIGNTNTSYTLDVSGSGRFTGNLTAAAFLGNLYTNTWYAGSGSTLSLRTAASAVIADFSPTSSNILGFVGINGSTAPAAALTVYDTTSGSEQLRLCNSNGGGYWGIGMENNVTGNLYFNSGGSLKVVFAASGNVGIGTSSPATTVHALGPIRSQDSRGGSLPAMEISGGSSLLFPYISVDQSNPMSFITGGAYRMLITGGGDVLVNKTSATNTGKFELNYSRNDNVGMSLNDTTASAGCGHIYFQRGGTNVGSITSPNNSSTAFNTSSDYRLKEDLQEINGLEKALAIKVYNFKWKNEEDRSDGVLAHELQQIVPFAVNGEKDELDKDGNIKPQGVDYSKLVPILIKAVQELQEQINELKNK